MAYEDIYSNPMGFGTSGNQGTMSMEYGGYQPDVGSSFQQPSYQSSAPPLDYGGNLNYPQYGGGEQSNFSTAGGLMGTAGTAATMTGNPYAMAGGLALKGLGQVSSIYGKYRERQESRKRYEEALAMWEEDRKKQEEDRQREIQRAQRQENVFGSQFSQGLEDRFAGAYGGYRQPGGG